MEEIEQLVRQVCLERDQITRKQAREQIRRYITDSSSIWPDSTYLLYQKMAKGEIGGFTVPAINIRTLTFDIAKLLFRLMKEKEVGALIFEIARSEIEYTHQPIEEYATVILAAAMDENWQGPVFIQGDHFQVKAKRFNLREYNDEFRDLKNLISQAVGAGVYNIDIDASTLVRLDAEELSKQQYWNYNTTARLTEFIRSRQPRNITISIGGEIGEIGGKNSTPEELDSFMTGYQKSFQKSLEKSLPDIKGLSKISVQTGASHGGIVLPDGGIEKVPIDFETLRVLSRKAREYRMAGAVQHGASTLPIEYFDKFPETGCCEIHLATEFQNVVYNQLPEDLRQVMYKYCYQQFGNEKKEGETDTQFLYKTRKKALGPFKEELWNLPPQVKERILIDLYQKFSVLFEKLKVEGTKEIV